MSSTQTIKDLKIPSISSSDLDRAIDMLASARLTQEESDSAIARIEHDSTTSQKHKEPEDTSR